MPRVQRIPATLQLAVDAVGADIDRMKSVEPLSTVDGAKLSRYILALCAAYQTTNQERELVTEEHLAYLASGNEGG